MNETVDAVYVGGVFRPVRRPDLYEGELVRLTVERVGKASIEDVSRLASCVYKGLSPEEIREIEEFVRRREFFAGPRGS